MQPGRLIFLNGVTSTGKSTVAECIREMSLEVFYISSNDLFHQMVSWNRFDGNFAKLVAHTITAQYYAVRGMLDGGFHVILDGMLLDLEEYRTQFGKSNAELFREIFAGIDCLSVNLVCDLEELRRRNRVRGNRGEMQSDEQLAQMTSPLQLDMTVDVMTVLPDECAESILRKAAIPYERMPSAKRERHRIRLLSDILQEIGAQITPSDDHTAVPTHVVHVKTESDIAYAMHVLPAHGYLLAKEKADGEVHLHRAYNGEITEAVCIRRKA